MDTKLKEQIMQAFEEGCTPVDAVIRFKVVPDTIMKMYEEHAQSKGGFVVWGNQMREIEKILGYEPGSIDTPQALVAVVELLAAPTGRPQ
jgi:hypothetical protein